MGDVLVDLCLVSKQLQSRNGDTYITSTDTSLSYVDDHIIRIFEFRNWSVLD